MNESQLNFKVVKKEKIKTHFDSKRLKLVKIDKN